MAGRRYDLRSHVYVADVLEKGRSKLPPNYTIRVFFQETIRTDFGLDTKLIGALVVIELSPQPRSSTALLSDSSSSR